MFETLDLEPRGKTCHGIKGIIEEGDEMMEEDGEEAVIDAGLIAGAQRAEHYEIAAYGYDKAGKLLARTREEEKAADQKLNKIAKGLVNPGGGGTRVLRAGSVGRTFGGARPFRAVPPPGWRNRYTQGT